VDEELDEVDSQLAGTEVTAELGGHCRGEDETELFGQGEGEIICGGFVARPEAAGFVSSPTSHPSTSVTRSGCAALSPQSATTRSCWLSTTAELGGHCRGENETELFGQGEGEIIRGGLVVRPEAAGFVIKRIIPYIASQYKRDKIWMRRSIPSKRNYQIMLAVEPGSQPQRKRAFRTHERHERGLRYRSQGHTGRQL
jgi:hypothetical protein